MLGRRCLRFLLLTVGAATSASCGQNSPSVPTQYYYLAIRGTVRTAAGQPVGAASITIRQLVQGGSSTLGNCVGSESFLPLVAETDAAGRYSVIARSGGVPALVCIAAQISLPSGAVIVASSPSGQWISYKAIAPDTVNLDLSLPASPSFEKR